MSYADGFVLAVPTANIADDRKLARKAGKVWREYGALEYREYIADDVKPGKTTSVPQSVKLKADETVFFSHIFYKSRKDWGRVNKKVMTDPRLKEMMEPASLPSDGKPLMWGGFKVFLDI